MNLASYYRSPNLERALQRYAKFAASKRWDPSHKLELYAYAKRAFGSGKGNMQERLEAFREIYGSLRRYWQVFRNGKSYWDPETAFENLNTKCKGCSRDSGLTLSKLSEEASRAQVAPCLAQMQNLKKLRSRETPTMAVSKFLHFFNPKLFPIYDNAYIQNKVLDVFRDDWVDFCARCGHREANEPARATGPFYLTYMRWASELVRQSDSALPKTFSRWFAKQPDCSDSIVLGEVHEYEATAWEFIAIGAALLEEEGGESDMRKKSFGEYVVSDPKVCHGKLTFEGTRVFVADVLDMVAEGMDWDAIIKECHGSIGREAIAEAVRLASSALLDHADDYAVEAVHG